MNKLILFTILGALAPHVAFAEDSEDSSVWDLNHQIRINVPKEFRKLQLRMSGGDLYKLNRNSISITTDEGQNRVELLSKNGAVLSDNFTRVDKSLFSKIRERNFILSAGTGSTYFSDKEDSERLQQANGMLSIDVGLMWLDGRFGLLSEAQGNEVKNTKDTVTSTYRQRSLRLLALTQFVPLSFTYNPFLKRIHFLIGLGAQGAQHEAEFSEYDLTINDRDQTLGPMGLFGARTTVLANVSLFLRQTLSIYKLKLEKLHYERNVQQNETMFGVNYAL